ncbi:hypothetical protein [Actinomyces procaprae]|uniref:hypothetical protein n=1 Tax=Actinomyces procaprae TaxID=2560010 RepID=UPI00109D94BB|nr:hypothetical protein [Actinomyces procaprae]
MAHGLRSLFATYELPFDETWNDLATLLYRPRLKDRSDTEIEDVIGDIVGGRFEVRDERFVLRCGTEGDPGFQLEAPLVSEGHRKLGMIQVLLATHSLFLLRELQMLDEDEDADIRYFGLDRANDDPVTVTQADDLDDLPGAQPHARRDRQAAAQQTMANYQQKLRKSLRRVVNGKVHVITGRDDPSTIAWTVRWGEEGRRVRRQHNGRNPHMALVVQKYGGSSVSDVEFIGVALPFMFEQVLVSR